MFGFVVMTGYVSRSVFTNSFDFPNSLFEAVLSPTFARDALTPFTSLLRYFAFTVFFPLLFSKVGGVELLTIDNKFVSSWTGEILVWAPLIVSGHVTGFSRQILSSTLSKRICLPRGTILVFITLALLDLSSSFNSGCSSFELLRLRARFLLAHT